jgi:hypothetical protein
VIAISYYERNVMRTEKLSLAHKELLYERLRRIDTPVSEYSFPNLYLFRGIHQYKVVYDEEVFVKGRSHDGFTYLMPTRDLKELDMEYLKKMMQDYDFLYPVPEDRLELFGPEDFSHSFSRGDTDYVYTAEKLRTFAGRKLHRKRNLMKQFTSSYKHEALPLTKERLKDARFVLEDWAGSSSEPREETDYIPCGEALELYEELVLCGGIYYAEDEPAGFIIGEEQNPETFVLHFAKARTKFKGVYQYIFNNFAGVLPAMYRYINLEQDLEKETLRLAKSSYVPDLMLRKARVRAL